MIKHKTRFSNQHLFFIFILLLLLLENQQTTAQVDTIYSGDEKTLIYKDEIRDTVDVVDTVQNYKNPGRAALYSALLPGLGQAYNGNFWKIPIVYTAVGTMIFWADYNNKNYHRFKTAYVYKTDTLASTIDEFGDNVSADNLLYYTKKHRRNRDLSIIVAVVFYAFNIVDAAVDSYMSDYDVGDDITMSIEPSLFQTINNKNAYGLSLNFRFK